MTKCLNGTSENHMDIFRVSDMETVANSIGEPNNQDIVMFFNNYFMNIVFKISKRLHAENKPEAPRHQQPMFLFKATKR